MTSTRDYNLSGKGNYPGRTVIFTPMKPLRTGGVRPVVSRPMHTRTAGAEPSSALPKGFLVKPPQPERAIPMGAPDVAGLAGEDLMSIEPKVEPRAGELQAATATAENVAMDLSPTNSVLARTNSIRSSAQAGARMALYRRLGIAAVVVAAGVGAAVWLSTMPNKGQLTLAPQGPSLMPTDQSRPAQTPQAQGQTSQGLSPLAQIPTPAPAVATSEPAAAPSAVRAEHRHAAARAPARAAHVTPAKTEAAPAIPAPQIPAKAAPDLAVTPEPAAPTVTPQSPPQSQADGTPKPATPDGPHSA